MLPAGVNSIQPEQNHDDVFLVPLEVAWRASGTPEGSRSEEDASSDGNRNSARNSEARISPSYSVRALCWEESHCGLVNEYFLLYHEFRGADNFAKSLHFEFIPESETLL